MVSNDWRIFDVGGARSLVRIFCSLTCVHTLISTSREVIPSISPTLTGTHMLAITAAWAPYFDNMDAIIFLAPLSGFDEVLTEDANTNRLVSRIYLPMIVVT